MIESFINDVFYGLLIMTCLAMMPIILVGQLIYAAARGVRNTSRKDGHETTTERAESGPPAAVVSREDGRVIAMVSPDSQPLTPAVTRPKDGTQIAKDVATQVAARAAMALVSHAIKQKFFKK